MAGVSIHEDVLHGLKWRYATKQFDASKKISESDWKVLEQSILLSPSSYGIQPWKAFVVTSDELKQKLPAAAWGQNQPRDCSHFVVFAARKHVDQAYVQKFVQRTADVRGIEVSSLNGLRDAILNKTSHLQDHVAWTARQCYIGLGFLLETAALLQIDACPMEGILPDKVDEILGLSSSHYTTVVACALGYRQSTDKYATAEKVRFEPGDLIQIL